MRVLVFERNLMWSSKLASGLRALGHESVVLPSLPAEAQGDVAIVNLGQPEPEPGVLIAALHEKGIRVIAHAGHKEKELLDLGRAAKADLLVTNGELSAKLGEVLSRIG